MDFRTAKDNATLVHPEEDWFPPCQVGGDPKRNLVASADEIHGDVEGIMAQCDIVLERTYHTKAYNQAMMEPFTAYANFDRYGRPAESSFMQYKVPTRLDMGRLKVEFEHSYEPTGPFGAKSIGEIVINTPAPAIAHAIYRATGKWFRELPITPEQIAMSLTQE